MVLGALPKTIKEYNIPLAPEQIIKTGVPSMGLISPVTPNELSFNLFVSHYSEAVSYQILGGLEGKDEQGNTTLCNRPQEIYNSAQYINGSDPEEHKKETLKTAQTLADLLTDRKINIHLGNGESFILHEATTE